MPDLAQRIQLTLGDAYAIVREIPGGGMSRLFLATETALRRSVVVKVLPPELASGVNTARFRREIEITAQLQPLGAEARRALERLAAERN